MSDTAEKLRRLRLLTLARHALTEAIDELAAELREDDPSIVIPSKVTIPPPTRSGQRPKFESPAATKKDTK